MQYQVPDLKQVRNQRSSRTSMFRKFYPGWGIGAFLSATRARLCLVGLRATERCRSASFWVVDQAAAQLKADADGGYMSPWSVNWVDNDGKQRTDPIDINCHCFDPTKNQVLTEVMVEMNWWPVSLGVAELREIDEAVNRRKNSEESYTFHGWDVYAYTAARLAAKTISFEQVGPVLPSKVVSIFLPGRQTLTKKY